MVKPGVITPVDEPSVAYAWKASGELCICLDIHDLNNAISRDHHCTPTVDEVAHEFAHSKYFTKLDARHRYWAVILDSNPVCSPPLNPIWLISFLTSFLWSILLPGCFPEED